MLSPIQKANTSHDLILGWKTDFNPNNFQNWEGWNKPGVKAPFNKEEGCHLKAALLSGPPGVGKTTSATVCSKVNTFHSVNFVGHILKAHG